MTLFCLFTIDLLKFCAKIELIITFSPKGEVKSGARMYKKCKTKHSINRQREIETAFLNLLKTKHYDDISVCEISDFAKIPRKAFYRYFENKEGILQGLISHTLQGYKEYCDQFTSSTAKRTIKTELTHFFNFWITEPRKTLLKALIKSNLIDTMLKFNKGIPLAYFMDMKKFFPEDEPMVAKQVLNFTISGLMSIMIDWFENGYKETPEQMATLACRLIEQPLFKNLESIGIYKE